MSDLALAFSLARRDLRGSLRGFAVFLACMALGVASIAAVGNLNAAVTTAFTRDAAILLGGDLQLEVAGTPIDRADLSALLPAGSRLGEVARTSTILTGPGDRRLPVAVKAVDNTYPLLGRVELDPNGDLATALADGGLVVERPVLARLGVRVGDSVRLGDIEARIGAVLEREPDRIGGLFNIGPRVLMSRALLARSGILQPGALVRYETRIVLPKGSDPAALAAAITAARPDSGWRVQRSAEVQPQVARLTDRLATFLTLAGLTALVTGGLGVAIAVRTHLARRIASIAILKSLGASQLQVLGVYLGEILLLALLGAALGLAASVALLALLQHLIADLLPVRLEAGLHLGPLLVAAGAGILTAVTFALWPLLVAVRTPPAYLFRAQADPLAGSPRRRDLALIALGAVLLAGLALLAVPQPRIAAWYVGGLALSLLILAGLAALALALLRRLPRRTGFALRLAVSNLAASGSGAASVLVAFGCGLTALTTTALLQANLDREVTSRVPQRAPALVLIDLQPGQQPLLEQAIATVPGAKLLQAMPSLRARLVRIKGVPVDQVPTSPEVAWTLSRDRGLTYEAAMPKDTKLVAGAWWPADYAGPPLLSLDSALAEGYGVGLGDTLTFNVLGRTLEARITSLRQEIDWSQGRLDFLFVMSPGLLDKAPHTFVAALDVPPAGEDALIEAAARAIPNATPLPVRAAIGDLALTLRKIGFAIDAVAGVTLVAGLLVLAAAIAAVRERQRYQAVMLKVLGASRATLRTAFLLEYGCLGLLAALIGGGLGTLAAWLLATRAMDLPWVLAPLPLLAVTGLAVGLALLVGALGLGRMLRQSAAPVLRGA